EPFLAASAAAPAIIRRYGLSGSLLPLMACHKGTKAKKTALRRLRSEVSCSKSRAETRLIFPPSKLRLFPISTKQLTRADLRAGYAMSLRAASRHLADGLNSAPPPVKAFICFRMAAMAMVSLPVSPEVGSL